MMKQFLLFLILAFSIHAAYVSVGGNLQVNNTKSSLNVTIVPLKPINNSIIIPSNGSIIKPINDSSVLPDHGSVFKPGMEMINCTACDNKNITDVIIPRTCNASQFLSPQYAHISPVYMQYQKPAYLENAYQDCDLLSRKDEADADIANKLVIIERMENRTGQRQNQAYNLLDRGQHAINQIYEAQHGLEAAGIVPMDEPFNRIEPTSGMMGNIGSQTVTELKNFNYAFHDVVNAENYTNASLATFVNIVEALELSADEGKCMFPETKEYYNNVLDSQFKETLKYNNQTIDFIEDTRFYAGKFNQSKSWVNAIDCMESISSRFEGVTYVAINQSQDNQTFYVVNTKVTKKLLGLFDVDYESSREVSQNGTITKEEKPWWSFLLFS